MIKKEIAEKLFKAELSEQQKVELKSEIQNLLEYHKGVRIFADNIDIDLKEIEKWQRGIRVDIENLNEDADKVKRGIKMADKAASDLGINPSSIPLYDEAKAALDYADKKIAKGKQALK